MNTFFEPYGEYGAEWLPLLARAMGMTGLVSVTAFILSFLLGLLLAVCRSERWPVLKRAVSLYVSVMRGVPLLALLFLLYFGLPGIGITFDAFTAAVVGLALVFAAQIAELFRAGLMALPKGQREAALAVGFTPWQCFRLIVLPQVMRIIAAPLIVTFVSLLKDSSLTSLITVNELMLTGRAMATEYFLPLQIFLAVGLCYFLIAWPFSLLSKRLTPATAR